MYFLYNIIFCIFFALYLPVIIYNILRGQYKKDLRQRLGILSDEIANKFRGEKTIWIHAVSVGETVAASSLVSEIKKRLPEHRILFSTVTDTGQEMAHKIIKEADDFIYFPFDFFFFTRRVIKQIKPELILIMETELWPQFIRTAHQKGSRVMLANGRISDKSFRGYKRLGPLFRDMLENIDISSMQSERDKEKIIELGAAQNKVYNNGNTKFDQSYSQPEAGLAEKIYNEFKIESRLPVLVAGSTHPGEEEQLLEVYKKIKSRFADLLFILAPRHIERVDSIAEYYEKNGVKTIRRTGIEERVYGGNEVILLDTIGELASIYSIADLVFIGGSLIEKGGHNVLEPAAHGKPVFFGSHMFNFRENTRMVLEYGAGVQVENKEELAEKMIYYLENRRELTEKGEKALTMVQENKGASERNARLAVDLLGNNNHGCR